MGRGSLLLILLPVGLGLSGCKPAAPAPAAPEISLEDATTLVHRALPAARYAINAFLTSADAPASPPLTAGLATKLRIGLPWVLNDEIAPWFVGLENGFYRDEGLELELVPGGPGIDPVEVLVGDRGAGWLALAGNGSGTLELPGGPARAERRPSSPWTRDGRQTVAML